MRILWGLVVGVVGCAITYFGATELGAIARMAAGQTMGTGLSIIIGLGGIAVTIALVFETVKPAKKPPSS